MKYSGAKRIMTALMAHHFKLQLVTHLKTLGVIDLVGNKMNKIHEKLVLFTIQSYMENAIKDGLTNEPLHHRIVSGVSSYKMMGRFSSAELKLVRDIGEHAFMWKIKEVQISFVVYALELLKLLVDEGYKFDIRVSHKKLKMGKATFAIEMLKLKNRDSESYNETKEIIDVSVLTAKQFFYYTKEQIELLHDK